MKKNQFQNAGQDIGVWSFTGGYVNFRVKVTMVEHVENDPNLKCNAISIPTSKAILHVSMKDTLSK